jgi:predicted amidophosphoribosyltransferase
MERHCAACAAKVGKQANFCHQCGTKIAPAPSAVST